MMARSRRASRRAYARSRDRGAAAVEFALVSTLLFTILFAIIQYSLYFWSLQSGSNAAREAARQAAVGALSCSDFTTLVKNGAQGVSSDFKATRTYYAASDVNQLSPVAATVGGIVKVKVSFKSIDLGFPFLPFIEDGRVSEAGIARIEETTDKSVPCS